MMNSIFDVKKQEYFVKLLYSVNIDLLFHSRPRTHIRICTLESYHHLPIFLSKIKERLFCFFHRNNFAKLKRL
jgi:hypothetical protein